MNTKTGQAGWFMTADDFCIWIAVKDKGYRTLCGQVISDPGRKALTDYTMRKLYGAQGLSAPNVKPYDYCPHCKRIIMTWGVLVALKNRVEEMPSVYLGGNDDN